MNDDAYRFRFEAGKAGADVRSNPYCPRSGAERHAWIRGWFDGQAGQSFEAARTQRGLNSR